MIKSCIVKVVVNYFVFMDIEQVQDKKIFDVCYSEFFLLLVYNVEGFQIVCKFMVVNIIWFLIIYFL